MRSIPESLKAKMRLLAQTPANNADPRLNAVIARRVIPIQEYSMWSTHKIANFTGRVSIAVARPNYKLMPSKVYVAGIDSGVAKIYAADFDGINAPTIWNKVLEISNAVEISLAYQGRFRPYKKGVEFYTTEEYPWMFWIDSSGNLYTQYWDDTSTKTLLGTNVTSCSATMGINSVQNDWGYGLMVAWTTVAGAVFYAQLFQGAWGDPISVTQASANATEVVISRVADVRMIFLIKDSSGAVTEMLFRSVAISLSNVEQIELSKTKVSANITGIGYTDTTVTERVELTGTTVSANVLSTLAPEVVSVTNIDDGNGNYGKVVLLVFKEAVYGFENQQSAFAIAGSSGPTYYCQNIIRGDELKSLMLTFQDFNNISRDCTLTYTPGTLSGAITAASAFTKTFTPSGLVPVAIPIPTLISASNADNRNIYLDFDLAVVSTDFSTNTDAFVITANEPAHVPKDSIADVSTTYTVSAVAYPPEEGGSINTKRLVLTLAEGHRLKCPQSDVSVAYNPANGNLEGEQGSSVLAFSQSFTPTNITPLFNPNILERVQVSSVNVTSSLTTIHYSEGYTGAENVQISNVSVTATLTPVSQLP